jgi:hypothetical protein
MISEYAQRFFENYTGKKPSEFITLAQSGSARVNFIAKTDKKFIITYNENIAENESFCITHLFSDLKLNTPKIFAVSDDRKCIFRNF